VILNSGGARMVQICRSAQSWCATGPRARASRAQPARSGCPSCCAHVSDLFIGPGPAVLLFAMSLNRDCNSRLARARSAEVASRVACRGRRPRTPLPSGRPPLRHSLRRRFAGILHVCGGSSPTMSRYTLPKSVFRGKKKKGGGAFTLPAPGSRSSKPSFGFQVSWLEIRFTRVVATSKNHRRRGR